MIHPFRPLLPEISGGRGFFVSIRAKEVLVVYRLYPDGYRKLEREPSHVGFNNGILE